MGSVRQETGLPGAGAFRLVRDSFAVRADKVVATHKLGEISALPGAPNYVLGAMRVPDGEIVVVDMHRRLGVVLHDRGAAEGVVVVALPTGVKVGFLDGRGEAFIEVLQSQLVPPPRLSARLTAELVPGMIRHDDGFALLLDIDRLFSVEELAGMTPGASVSPTPRQR